MKRKLRIKLDAATVYDEVRAVSGLPNGEVEREFVRSHVTLDMVPANWFLVTEDIDDDREWEATVHKDDLVDAIYEAYGPGWKPMSSTLHSDDSLSMTFAGSPPVEPDDGVDWKAVATFPPTWVAVAMVVGQILIALCNYFGG